MDGEEVPDRPARYVFRDEDEIQYHTDGSHELYEKVHGDRWRRVPMGQINGYHPVRHVPESHFVDAGDGFYVLVHGAYVDLACEGELRPTSNLDAALITAMRSTARIRLEFFAAALEEHQAHRTFHTHGWAYSREVGFTCNCSGAEQEWRVSLTRIREMLPDARDSFMRMYEERLRPALGSDFSLPPGMGRRVWRRKVASARRRARSLLHRHLTREQRWDLRGSHSFEVVGQDGRAYQITEGSCNNVFLLEGGERRFRLCVVAKVNIPIYDLMLAQKLMIESDIRSYLKLAQAFNVRTRFAFAGSLLIDGTPDDAEQAYRSSVRSADVAPVRPRTEVPDLALEDPEHWVSLRLHQAEIFNRREHADADAEQQAG